MASAALLPHQIRDRIAEWFGFSEKKGAGVDPHPTRHNPRSKILSSSLRPCTKKSASGLAAILAESLWLSVSD
jgi:hypothetical protein